MINGSSDRAACEKVAGEARKLGAKTLIVMGDVGKPEGCKRIAAEAIEAFGAVDVLVNNAALRPGKPFLEMSETAWRRVIAVDLDAAVWLARACLPGMLNKGWGRIVNFTGMNAIHGYAGRAPVSVAKHGVWGLTKSLAKEFGPKGVTTNAISPGPIAADVEDNPEFDPPPPGDDGARAAGTHGKAKRDRRRPAAARVRRRRLRQRPDAPGERRRGNLSAAYSIGRPVVLAMALQRSTSCFTKSAKA